MGKTIRHGGDTVSMHRASAMAMQKRHGRHAGQIHKDRRIPRGGTRNELREFLNDADEIQEVYREVSKLPINNGGN